MLFHLRFIFEDFFDLVRVGDVTTFLDTRASSLWEVELASMMLDVQNGQTGFELWRGCLVRIAEPSPEMSQVLCSTQEG